MLGFPIGLVTASVGEWLIHKYVLHEHGKRNDAYFSHHWRQHHRDSRRLDGMDPNYNEPVWQTTPRMREALGLIGMGVAISPLLPVFPGFCAGVWTHEIGYYLVHKKAHQDPAWMRKYLPWHYDHHMGRNQHANWCVVHPLADYLFGTREKWAGTPEEEAALARIAKRKQTRVSAVGHEVDQTLEPVTS